jgi:hypothetical protein
VVRYFNAALNHFRCSAPPFLVISLSPLSKFVSSQGISTEILKRGEGMFVSRGVSVFSIVSVHSTPPIFSRHILPLFTFNLIQSTFFSSFAITVKPTISNPIPMNAPQNNSVNLINNFNNNYRTQTQPHCVALYDFEAENPGELSFKVRWVGIGEKRL